MLDAFLAPRNGGTLGGKVDLFVALEHAATAMGRLDQALDGHPLLPAFLHRARLEAVRRQAGVDGYGIDPWHLAATIEGLRLRMDHALRIVDRGAIFEAARTAFGLHQWITAPDFDQEGEVQDAERHLAASPLPSALLAAATGTHAWLHAGGTRPPIRAALVRFWRQRRVMRAAVPLTGPRALAAEAPDGLEDWSICFLRALGDEAFDYLDMLFEMDRGWRSARARAGGRRSTSRAGSAIDVMAAAPLASATSLAASLGMSIKCATGLLDGFVRDGIAVEVTHRAKRRLFGLAGLAPLRDGVSAPRRPEPGRGRGRPRSLDLESEPAGPPPPLPSLSRLSYPPIDYAALEFSMANADLAVRRIRAALDQSAHAEPSAPPVAVQPFD